ncbi:WD repeat protein [Calothrix parasitica NIES-267]|uniref:WD repeat protein n=1 Tax=Calothrix parasitica NIES-267 TaxID=1973488 RepID=A0A1Z4LH24_9CYAN|nr:WD repeat protein [Calothrix parasitica NIES-267]
MEDKQPKEYDAVLGGQNSAPSNGLVLGGIEGAKQRLINGDENYRLLALSQLINYGQEGLDLVIQSLKDSSEKVQLQAYKLLRYIPEVKIRAAIQEFNPYRFFECVHTTYSGYTYLPVAIGFNPNGKTLLFCCECINECTKEEMNSSIYEYMDGYEEDADGVDIEIIEVDVETGERIRIIEGQFKGVSICSFALNSDAQTLVIGGNDYKSSTGRIELWNLEKKELINVLTEKYTGYKNTEQLAYNAKHNILVCGSTNGKIIVWNLETQKLSYIEGHSREIKSLNISKDGLFLVSSSSDATLKVWDLKTQENIHTFKARYAAISVVIHPSEKNLVCCHYSNIYVWNLETGEKNRTFEEVYGIDAEFLTISLDGKTVVTCGEEVYGTPLRVWDFDTGEYLIMLPEDAKSAAISPNGQTIASFSGCGVIKIWRVP